MHRFKAIRVFDSPDGAVSRFVEIALDDLDHGGVVIKSAYSGINYKDALAVTGIGKIIRRSPCIAGIEVVGTVHTSADTRFHPGDPVIVHGFGLGVSHDGGFSPYVRVPGDWVMPLPEGLDMLTASAIGVAGYTAALAIHRMEQHGLRPAHGPVLVTGATGGVAGLGIDMLAAAGYTVVAMTGKPDEAQYLTRLGAQQVIDRHARQDSGKPLEKAQWAGALDSVGGACLAWLIRTTRDEGVIASFGNAGGHEFNTTVLPFILRGVQLIGINANSPMPVRQTVWQRIASDLKPRHVKTMTCTIPLGDVPRICQQQIESRRRGRTIIDFG